MNIVCTSDSSSTALSDIDYVIAYICNEADPDSSQVNQFNTQYDQQVSTSLSCILFGLLCLTKPWVRP